MNAATVTAAAVAATYQTGTALPVKYVGIIPIALSGITRQITWEMSPAGFFTTASTNSEHSTVVPPYVTRRRQENLPQDSVRALQNLLTQPTGNLNAVQRFVGRNGG